MKKKLFLVLSGLLLFILSGCATLPTTLPLPGPDQQRIAMLFQEAVARRQDCDRFLDAQVQVVLKSALQGGTISGFVQAMAPSFVKFVGLNPLGQPLLMMATDGRIFHTVSVPEARWYEGEVSSPIFKKYAPERFDPGQGFYWLVGALPAEGLQVLSVEHDAESRGEWLVVAYPDEKLRRHVLFDPAEQVILRVILADADGRMVMDVRYDRYEGTGAQGCALPGHITVRDSGKSGAVMEITMGDWLTEVSFTESDFQINPPPGFEKVIIK